MAEPRPSSGRAATPRALSEYAETCSAVETSSQVAARKSKAPRGAKPIEWTTPCRASVCSRTRSASASRSSVLVTSSSTSGAGLGSRRAIAVVIFICRPNEVRTTSAPSSWASRATWKAIEESVRTPVTSSVLPSSRPMAPPVRRSDLIPGRSMAHPQTAVDRQHRAADVRGGVGGEEPDRGRDLVRPGEPAGGDRLEVGRSRVLGQDGGHVGLDEARRDDVGGDAPDAELAGHGPRDADDPGLARAVVHPPGRAVEPDDAGDEDHAAAAQADHSLARPTDAAEGTGQVGVDDRVEVLVAHAQQQLVTGETGVRDEDLDRALVLLDLGEGRVDRGGVRHVAADAEEPLRLLPGAVRDRDAVAVRRQGTRDGQADPPVPPGDEHAAAHGIPPVCSARFATREDPTR